jgi:hypothetical protein
MLTQVADPAAPLNALNLNAPRDFVFRNFTLRRPGTILLADNPGSPRILVAHRGADFMLHAYDDAALQAAAADLFAGRIAQEPAWPDAQTLQDWDREGPYIFINSSPVETWRACLAAGFKAPDDFIEGSPAGLYWMQGQPRLQRHIRHSCRLGRGMELWDRLRRGVSYDPEGEYVRLILQSQPSFVCEVDGQPVCWSTMHLNGTTGMIYTPEEHRRRGYARSLAAFQLDHVLRREGFVCCHVVGTNVASYSMLLDMGATREPDLEIVWRAVLWPKGTATQSGQGHTA